MITTLEIAGRLALGAGLGSIIGLERERRAWTAGLRTHMMVCLGSTLIMLVSCYGFEGVIRQGVVLDPSRIAAQVVSGIGFLGAGTIVFMRNEIVRGLTTAAGLWAVAGIGLAVGSGMYWAALATTFIALIILLVFRTIEVKLFSKNKFKSIKLLIKTGETELKKVEDVLNLNGIHITEISLYAGHLENTQEMQIKILKDFTQDNSSLTVIEKLKQIDGVIDVNAII